MSSILIISNISLSSLIFDNIDCIQKMDFLPVDNSDNARLQYTESYVLPTDTNTDFTSNKNHDLHDPSHIQVNHYNTNHNSSHAQPVITIHEPTVKIGEDIDSYINRRTKHEQEEHPKSTFDQSVVNIHSVFKPSKPVMLESHVESISNKHLETQHHQPSETPIIPEHPHDEPQIDILDEIDTIKYNQVSQSSRISKPNLHFRQLQQSSVNIVIDHDVKKKDAEEVIPPIANASQTLKSQAVNRLTRNLQKYEVKDPILERSDERYNPIDEDIVPKKPHNDSFDIPSIQPSQAHFVNDSKQYLRRKLNGSQVDQSNIIINHMQQHEEVHPILTDKEIAETPIFVSPSQEQDSLSMNKKNLLKRSIQQRKLEEPLSYSINSYHTEHIQQTRKYPLLERSLLLEKTEPPMALNIHDSLEESMSSSPRHSQKRKLQANKLTESVPLHFEPDLQDSLSSSLNYPHKRKLVASKLEEAIPLQLQPSLQHSLVSSPKDSQKRNLQAVKLEDSLPLHLEPDVEHSLSNSFRHSQKRNLQPGKLEESLPLHVQPDLEHSLISSPKQSLKRSLEAKRIGESMQIHLEDDKSQHLPDKSSSILYKRSIEQKAAEGSLILPPDINDVVEEHFVEANPQQFEHQQPVLEKLDESVHLSERLETMPSPKNILPLKRDLKFNHVIPHQQHQQQQPVLLNEVSHQAIQSQNNQILSQPRFQPQPEPEPILVDYSLEEESFKTAKKANPFLRNLKPSVKPTLITSQSLSQTSDQGWNPSKKIFHLFKLPDLDSSHSQPISFTKSRISTASTHR